MDLPDFGFNGRYILDEHGNPMPEPDLLKWALWMEGQFRRVEVTKLESGVRISTVFLGLDHNFSYHAYEDPLHYRPVLWETMIFDGPLDHEQRRYDSREDAVRGHWELVELAKQKEAEEAAELCKIVQSYRGEIPEEGKDG